MMADRRKIITLGIAAAVAVLATVVSSIWISLLLFVLAAFLIAWGMEPKRTEEFVGRLPYGGSYILKALAKLDSMLSSWS
jgi:Flp pilus assembly protein TadB